MSVLSLHARYTASLQIVQVVSDFCLGNDERRGTEGTPGARQSSLVIRVLVFLYPCVFRHVRLAEFQRAASHSATLRR